FTVPLALLLIGEGIDVVQSLLISAGPKAAFAICLLPAALLLGGPTIKAVSYLLHPRMVEHLRPVVASVKKEKLSNDSIYVFYGAIPAFSYYRRQYDIGPTEYYDGIDFRQRPTGYIGDMDQHAH